MQTEFNWPLIKQVCSFAHWFFKPIISSMFHFDPESDGRLAHALGIKAVVCYTYLYLLEFLIPLFYSVSKLHNFVQSSCKTRVPLSSHYVLIYDFLSSLSACGRAELLRTELCLFVRLLTFFLKFCWREFCSEDVFLTCDLLTILSFRIWVHLILFFSKSHEV